MSLISTDTTDALLNLAKIVCRFSQVDRMTFLDDGVTPESDTDHTVMLGLIALAFAKEFAPHLDRGLIAQFVYVHDLVEAYAGDTPTLNTLSADQKSEKVKREEQALERIRLEIGSVLPWVHEMIEEYERLDTPEARYVKVMDKLMPKITHVLNEGVRLKISERTETLEEHHRVQIEHLTGNFADQPEALAAIREFNEIVQNAVWRTFK